MSRVFDDNGYGIYKCIKCVLFVSISFRSQRQCYNVTRSFENYYNESLLKSKVYISHVLNMMILCMFAFLLYRPRPIH